MHFKNNCHFPKRDGRRNKYCHVVEARLNYVSCGQRPSFLWPAHHNDGHNLGRWLCKTQLCLRLQVHLPCLSSWRKLLWIMWGMGLTGAITPSVHVSDFIAAILSVRRQSALHPAHTANYFFFGSCPSLIYNLVSLSYCLMFCFSHLHHFYTIKFNLLWGNVHCF